MCGFNCAEFRGTDNKRKCKDKGNWKGKGKGKGKAVP